ncbi:Uncharacterised protein [Segatella copri]|nr:Uncharacterised protein [Segatella copri]
MFGIWLRSTFDLPTVNNTVGCKLVAVAGFTYLGVFWHSLSAFWRSLICLSLAASSESLLFKSLRRLLI